MSDTQATLTAKAPKFEQMLRLTALGKSGDDPPWVHSDVYLDITEDGVDALVSAGGGSIVTYCTFEPSYFDELEGSAEAVIDVQPTLDRLQIASNGGRMQFQFEGEEDELAERLVADGALEMAVALPASEKVMDKVPQDLPERFTDENELLSPSGNPHQTYIDTTVEQVEKIIEAVDLVEDLDFYPIAVEEGDFSVAVGDDIEYLRGELQAEVEGPDLTNWYDPGFVETFDNTLNGDVQLQTTPGEDGGFPLAVIQEDEDKSIRHVLVQINPA